ncbi:MAG: hypothetical protein D6722_06225, partial [Bacteroidetes bacterium]
VVKHLMCVSPAAASPIRCFVALSMTGESMGGGSALSRIKIPLYARNNLEKNTSHSIIITEFSAIFMGGGSTATLMRDFFR